MKETTGFRLKKLRLERGVSLEEVQKQTKVHLNILRAIEEDNLVGINPVYLKGFLKIYCKFLNVDPREFIPDYKEPQKSSRQQEAALTRNKTEGVFKRAVFNLGSEGNRRRIAFLLWVLVAAVLIWGLFKSGQFIARRIRIPARKVASVSPAVLPGRQQKAGPAKIQDIPISKNIRLGILAREDCLIQLKCDGRTMFKGNLKRGRSESWQAKEKMELSLGNAGAVELEVNGKRISSLGKRGKPLRNIVITREGLSVGK